jgi:hypothetical protein
MKIEQEISEKFNANSVVWPGSSGAGEEKE